MPIYWSFSAVPELAARSRADREAAIKRVGNLAMKHWEWWAALAVACVLTGTGAWLGGRGISGALGAGIGGALGGAIHHLVVIHVARESWLPPMTQPVNRADTFWRASRAYSCRSSPTLLNGGFSVGSKGSFLWLQLAVPVSSACESQRAI